jgi:hypothetical protein
VWLLFIAQSWALWLFRNKMTIESKFMKHPANIIFKTMLFLQMWMPLARPLDRPWIEHAVAELKLLNDATSPRRLDQDA